MSSDPAFSQGLKNWHKLTEAQALVAQRGIALHLYVQLTAGWPVDKGRSRAGWVGSVDSPSDYVPPPGSYPAMPALPDLSGSRLGGVVWLCNNVVYSVVLNEGHSSQMPAKFVESTLARIVSEYNAGAEG